MKDLSFVQLTSTPGTKIRTILHILLYLVSFILLSMYVRCHHSFASGRWLSHKKNSNKIPSIVHFVLGQSDRQQIYGGNRSTPVFSFINYVTLLAARRHLRPNELFVHYQQEPILKFVLRSWKRGESRRSSVTRLISVLIAPTSYD